MVRTIPQWENILEGLTPEQAVGKILGDLTHYYSGRAYEDDDKMQLKNALIAFTQTR